MHCCDNHAKHSGENIHPQPTNSKKGIAAKWPYLCGTGIVGVVLAVTVFKISPANLLFYGVLLACPLMHVFMMKGHDHGEDHKEQDSKLK